MKFKKILPIVIINLIFIISLIIPIKAKQTDQFHPIADSYVSEIYPDENYGNETYICATNESTIAYIKFDITPIPIDDYVNSAQLNLKVQKLRSGIILWDYHYPNSVVAYYTTNVEWNENDITWNNKPEFNPDAIDYDHASSVGNWSDWNITEVARENRMFTIVLKNADIRTEFYSRESDFIPTLVISYTEKSTSDLIELGFNILRWLIFIGFFAALLGIIYIIIRKKRK